MTFGLGLLSPYYMSRPRVCENGEVKRESVKGPPAAVMREFYAESVRVGMSVSEHLEGAECVRIHAPRVRALDAL